MGDGERLLHCFRESPSGILQLAEIEEWNGGRGVQQLLQGMVDGGVLGCRMIKTSESQHTIYWLKKSSVPTNTTDSHTPFKTPKVATPMSASLKAKLKRSRPRFVSPLLSSSKKPRLSSPTIGVAGKLDFSEEVSSTTKETPSKDQKSSSVTEGAPQSITLTEGAPQSSTLAEGAPQSNTLTEGEQLRMLVAEKVAVQLELEEAQEKLRKLKMVKMYRSKNDLQQLDSLTRKWREVSQEAVQELLKSSTHNPPPTTQQLLDYLHIDYALIQYSVEDESFY